MLITGGAGFIGATLALELGARHPDWEITALRQPPPARLRAQPARACARPGPASSTATCAQPDDLLGGGRVRRARRVLGRALGAGRRRRRPDYVVQTNLRRRLPLPGAGAAAAARRSCSSPPAACTRSPRSNALALREADTRFELADEQPLAGASSPGIAEDFPLDGRADAVRRDQARRRAADRRVPRRATGCARSIDRCGVIAGPWQMGKVDQGVFTYWMLAHHFRPPARATSASAAAASRCATCCTSTTWSSCSSEQLARPRALGRARRSTSAAGATCSLSLLETTASVRGDHRATTSRSAAIRETRPGDVPHLHLRLRAAVRADRLAPAAAAAARSSPTSTTGSHDHESGARWPRRC